MRKPCFPVLPDRPAPLRVTVHRCVRFEEVDPLGIVWHGRYPGYAEDARVALYERYGIGYMDLYRHGVIAPIKQMHLDYCRPLHFQDSFTIEGLLHWSDAVRLNFEFIIRDAEGRVATRGYTVQLLLDSQENLLLVPPLFYAGFRERWLSGSLGGD